MKRLPINLLTTSITNFLIFIFLFYLFKPALLWIWGQIVIAENSFHVIAVVLLLALAIRAMLTKKFRLNFCFIFKKYPFVIIVAGCILFLLNEYFIGIHIFSATLMLITLYGLLGFYLSMAAWNKAFLPFALFILLLPFEGYLDVYLGFPLRLFSAEVVKNLLSNLGVAALTSESVILIENKAAIVDLSCSGLKGLWAGLIFYIFLTWIENKKLSFRWLLGLVLFTCSLIGFNIFRIVSLVTLELVFNLPRLASYAHTIIGILGFVFSCIFGWFLMRFQINQQGTSLNQFEVIHTNFSNKPSTPQGETATSKYCGLTLLLTTLIGSTLIYKPFPKQQQSIVNKIIALPIDFKGEEIAFLPIEEKFFKTNSAHAIKYQFESGGQQGSLIFVYSHYWKSQHDPRNCYISQDITVDYEETLTLPSTSDSKPLKVKYLHLNSGKKSGFYWFQSPTKQTADYSSRVFSSWLAPGEPWIMISVAWEGELTASETEKFVTQLYRHINKYF